MADCTPEEILTKISLGMLRDQVVAAIGEPDAMGGASRKYRTPSIYRYGDIELWFGPRNLDTLREIWNERSEEIMKGVGRPDQT